MTTLSISEDLREHYAGYYRGASPWRDAGARDKAANVLQLCADVPHDSLVEIGAGEGALLQRLAELDFGAVLTAVDVSTSALTALRDRRIPGLRGEALFDGYGLPFPDARFDLAILSHVLEHAEHPRALLREAARVARHVFVEVPLEDTWRLPRDYRPDALGHINFWSAKGLRREVQTCGLEVLAECATNPSRETYEARPGVRAGRARASWAVKEALLQLAPALARRLFTYHGSLLCRMPE